VIGHDLRNKGVWNQKDNGEKERDGDQRKEGQEVGGDAPLLTVSFEFFSAFLGRRAELFFPF
jgi:hypothetical protein